MGDELGEDDSVLAVLGKWRVEIRRDFDDLFNRRVAFRHQGSMTSTFIPTQWQKFPTTSHTG